VAEWYEEAFRADYLRVYPHRDDASAAGEVRAWAGRLPGLARGRRVLDVACGAGRHLRALRAAGIRAVGCDLSEDLLAAAAARASRCLLRCDMRALPFADGTFDAVTSFFSSFGYFPGEDADARVLREEARVLGARGGLLLDLMDPETVRRDLVPRSERESGGMRLVEVRSLSADGRRVEKEVSVSEGGRERRWRESVRLYDPAEVEGMAAAAGLVPSGRFAGHGPEPWSSGAAPRCVLLFRKAVA
jgi:SAM-dependent methyltransferase